MTAPARRLASIDLGTNTVRLLVVDAGPTAAWRVLEQDQTVTRLGEGLATRGCLAEEPMARTRAVVAGYLARARRAGAEEVRVIATSRVDATLPVPRWRLDGRVAEIRQDVLRFDAEETALLVRSLGDVDLDAADVATLVERTEGWPAGIGLSLLSVRGRDDGAEFVRTAFPPDRMVADYLLEPAFRELFA